MHATTFTGLEPLYGQCPGVDAHGKIHSLPQLKLDANREEILAYFQNSWALTEVLFSGLANNEAFTRRPYHQLRHPMIFYYGHPVTVYVNKLRVAGLFEGPVNAKLEALFEVGVDEMRWDDLHEGAQHIWPSVEEVRDYRAEVYQRICTLIETHPALAPEHLPITIDSPMWALVMGFEHERIHLETSSVLIRELPVECVRPPAAWPALGAHNANRSAPENRMTALSDSRVELGKPREFPSFGWDNEYGHESRHVRPFAASAQLISNAEFLQFVRDGGYTREQFWSREGWAWRRFRNVKWPSFWVQNGPAGSHLYQLRTVFEIIDLPLDWPVMVNFHEAKAYCAWASARDELDTPYRLLSEAEHHALRGSREVHDHPPGNLNLAHGSECAVDAQMPNEQGFHDVFGNAWQWCEDHFHPLQGSKPHPFYDDFSAPCYDGEHQMILGGSFASTGDMAERFARFHFRPHFFQHASFRIARNTDGNPASDAKLLHKNNSVAYESSEMLGKYLLMHFGSEAETWGCSPRAAHPQPQVVNLPLACAKLVLTHAPTAKRVLDLGCAVGGSTFELARHCREVVGIDYSREFVDSANLLKRDGALRYMRRDTGGMLSELTATIDPSINRDRLRFEQGDACALPLHLHGFDAVLMANVLCRLPDPVACLSRMQGSNALVKPGGVLVMTTPFSWLEEYTPQEKWLAGIREVGEVLSEFELLESQDLPFMIRDHARRFEYIITLASVWRRRA